jgi:Fe-S cluster assembly protein SufB
VAHAALVQQADGGDVGEGPADADAGRVEGAPGGAEEVQGADDLLAQPHRQGLHGGEPGVAGAGEGQHQDAGAKMVHCASYTSCQIISKSVARAGGRTSYRGLAQVQEGAAHSKSTVKCDALLVDAVSRSDTYPYVDIREDDVEMGHEASVSKISEDQLFYLMSRGMTEDEAAATIVRGFVEPIARELPMEYALELNRLIELQMEGSVG